jgi:hypothetical protein
LRKNDSIFAGAGACGPATQCSAPEPVVSKAAVWSVDTAASAIAIAEWFSGEQLRIQSHSRNAARRKKCDGVLELLVDLPRGVTVREVQRARIAESAEQARALLAQMKVDGELLDKDSTPDSGGHATRSFTKTQKFA